MSGETLAHLAPLARLAGRARDWEGCANVRDLGGLPTRDGGATRRGALFRADLLGHLSPRGWASLWGDGVRTVIDLRAAHEVAAAPYAPQLDAGRAPGVLALPIEEFHPAVSARIAGAASRAEVYTIILEGYPAALARIMRAIIAAPGAVALHCQAGKDRTGTVAALLLDLADVPHDAIAADYAISQLLIPPAGGAGFWGQPTATADMARQLLAWLGARGGARGYLGSIGLAERELAALRARLRDG